MTGPIDFLKWRYAAEGLWWNETGLPFPDNGWEIIRDEMAARRGEVIEKHRYPVIFTNEEAAVIAKKLGADDKADDLGAEIMSKAEEIVKG